MAAPRLYDHNAPPIANTTPANTTVAITGDKPLLLPRSSRVTIRFQSETILLLITYYLLFYASNFYIFSFLLRTT